MKLVEANGLGCASTPDKGNCNLSQAEDSPEYRIHRFDFESRLAWWARNFRQEEFGTPFDRTPTTPMGPRSLCRNITHLRLLAILSSAWQKPQKPQKPALRRMMVLKQELGLLLRASWSSSAKGERSLQLIKLWLCLSSFKLTLHLFFDLQRFPGNRC